MYSMYFFQHILFELVCFSRSAVYTQHYCGSINHNDFFYNSSTKNVKSHNENFCKKKCLKLFQKSSINGRFLKYFIKRLKQFIQNLLQFK